MTARVERWLYPVSLILLTQTTTLALGFASPRTVAIAAVETRVGEFEVALNLLKTVSDKGPRSSEFFLVQARAYVGLRQLKLAQKALERVTAIHLLPAKRLVAFESASLGGDLEAMTVNAEHLLKDDAIPASHRQRVQLRLARTRLRNGVKVTKAIHVLQRLARRASDYSVRAAAWQALARHGVDGARRTLQIEYPTHARQSETGAMEPVQLSEKQRMKRAENLFSLRAYTLAQVDFLALSKSSDARLRQLAQLRLGTILMRLRNDYAQSATWLRLASEGPERALALDSAYRHAVVTGYLGHYRKASALMEDLVSKLKGRRKTNARYQTGRLLHEAGLYDQAVEKHRPFVQTRAGRRPKWIWFLGWSKFRSSDCGRAHGTFSRLKDNPNTLIGPKATYWLARCARLKGEHRRGEALLTRLGQQAPLTYYGLLGRALRGGLSTRQMQRRHVPDIAFVGPWQKQLEPETRRILARIQALVRTGFIKLARHIYKKSLASRLPVELVENVLEQARADVEVILEMWGARWKRQSKWVRRIPWRIGFRQLASEQAAEAYPAAYYHLAKAAGRAYDVSPWWLMAHMLQESRYKEKAVSHARALGLMQILPRTGRRIAQRIGFPSGDFWDDSLFEPAIALRQAAWYLSALRREYDGNIVLAMAAYNGGPRRVSEHMSLVGRVPFDMMVEEIGAHETRNYARKVTDHLIRYVELYASDRERSSMLTSLLPPNELPVPKSEIHF